jgi:rhodanese-related sulfurtransferase
MSNVKRVSPEDAKKLCDEGWTYVDVRSQPEFEESHPAGAFNVPLLDTGPSGMQPNPDFLAVMQAVFPQDAKIVLGCRSGNRSLRAAGVLVSAGYTNVVDQRAGFEGARDPFGGKVEKGWRPVGLPTETGAPEGRSYPDLHKKKG